LYLKKWKGEKNDCLRRESAKKRLFLQGVRVLKGVLKAVKPTGDWKKNGGQSPGSQALEEPNRGWGPDVGGKEGRDPQGYKQIKKRKKKGGGGGLTWGKKAMGITDFCLVKVGKG